VILVAGAVVALRVTEEPGPGDPELPLVHVDRYAANFVVIPEPGTRPAAPHRVVATPGPGTLRVSWADGLPGGEAPDGAAGYDVRWDGEARLVVTPDLLIEGLTDGESYRVEVRTVDAFGRRSTPTATTAEPGRADTSWQDGMTGYLDDFSDGAAAGWHLSGYPGCVDPGAPDSDGLPIHLSCGADLAVLRARTPLRLGPPAPGGVLGRVAVRTDAAGPGGELTIDLVPGVADRVGIDVVRARAGRDPALPGGTIRVVVNDDGVAVGAAPDVPAVTPPTLEVTAAPRRGPGVPHLFEVVLTTGGVRVYQDGQLMTVGGVLPSWSTASALIGLRGPDGRRSRVHVWGAGFSGPETPVAPVAEVRAHPATQRILALDEPAPQVGMSRAPLASAASARLVTTLSTTAGLDPHAVFVQFGELRVPARPATPTPSATPAAAVTVIADVPAEFLGPDGPPSVTPLVLRAASGRGVQLVESYLEVTPGPGWVPPSAAPPERLPKPKDDLLPAIEPRLTNSAGEPLPDDPIPARGQVILTVALTAAATQWDTGAVAGVQGVQVRLDGTLVAGIPTDEEGPAVGGEYAMSIALAGLTAGRHALEIREYGLTNVESRLLYLTVS
jgi:hypothetical protein